MKKSGRIACIVALFCVATAVDSPAQTFTTLLSFDTTNGAVPYGSLVQGINGNLFGTTTNGGARGNWATCGSTDGCGTIFEMTPGGTLATLYSFCSQTNCTDGWQPEAGVTPGANGNFYGTTTIGGASGGTIFETTSNGGFTILYAFCTQTNCADGEAPNAPLVLGFDGNFYGTAYANNGGAIFKITPTGNFTTLYHFCPPFPHCSDGDAPAAPLVQATNGRFYGTTTTGGGRNDEGTVFTITPSGQLTTLYRFCSQVNCPDGSQPYTGLIQGGNGNFYGTTFDGGTGGGGTVFEITPNGQLTTLYMFCSQTNCTDGSRPNMFIQGADGNFYGTTQSGGANGQGTVFQMTPAGQLTTLHTFCEQVQCPDGSSPSGLVQGTDGVFYGTTSTGGDSTHCNSGTCGTAFSLSTGLSPFVRANPAFGRAGKVVAILGNHLTGTTSVMFNGTPATFTVVADTFIKATVPSGATTGTIQATTPNGTLNSNVPFQILP